MLRRPMLAAALLCVAAAPARAGSLADGWHWLSTNTELQTYGAIWNDAIGDGKDRWKTGGVTQAWALPDTVLGGAPWFEGRASALELGIRGLVITPDDTSSTKIDPKDRPYAQYPGIGLYLRSIARPRTLTHDLEMQTEDRAGIELGWQGDPLPFFKVQAGIHDMLGTGGTPASLANEVPREFLANLDGRHTWRLHWTGPAGDLEAAPFVQGALGMRENSLRIGADLITGSALEARTWGNDLATGALLSGASKPRHGFNWATFVGGDVGYVASDAFLDGGFAVHGPSVPRERITTRLRAGLLLEYDKYAVSFSLNWLSPEFRGQPGGQVIGAVQLKYRF